MTQQQKIVPNVMMWFSFASLALLYGVMLLGIYITASHQGLSCPNWPLCPNGFDIPPPKYFFEHIHRVIAVITAGMILVTAVCATKKGQKCKKDCYCRQYYCFSSDIVGYVGSK